MAIPPKVPAGWYTDPSARHERRYWDGTDWTAHVSDGGVTATDQPGAQPAAGPEHPAAGPEHPAEAPPAAGPVTATPAPRRRRAAALPLIVAAAVVVLGLAAGLLIWAPWQSPPLLRPAGLAAGPSTTSSVAFRWSRPATGPPPDRYVILHDGRVAGSVPGTVTSYQATGLAPATAYRYQVAAERGGQRSARRPSSS